ncbi:MAG: hypothetical protein EPO11_05560 [Gammaproteobacteria bacterium]|nr:MAG: hypothetical protein EPO11_05560 [Gammaproteobacteria bacterium]
MQLIISRSKYLILAVLSCLILIVWDSSSMNDNLDAAFFIPANTADSVWSSLRSEFKLDHHVQSSRVQAEIRNLLSDQDKLYQILQAAGPYIYFIQQQTKARGLPAELALIPFVESEFNPNDHSNKGATGLWQLMRGTAHELGIKVKAGYDGRRNVIDSTKAALAYFKDLGNEFKGNWDLAIAAYDCGQGKVESVQRRTGSDDYWDLPLPKETKYYVPRLLAVAEIIQNPDKYGVKLPPVNNEAYFTELKTKKSVNLIQVSKSSGISLKTLNTLNPDYNHGPLPKNGKYSLLIPVDKEPVVRAKFADTI